MASSQLHIIFYYHAIAALPETQRRRLVMYYFYDLTYKQIAELERCSVHSVFVAIKRAEDKIKNFFNNFQK